MPPVSPKGWYLWESAQRISAALCALDADARYDRGIDCEIVLLFEDAFSEDGRYFYDKCLEKGIRTVSEGNYGAYRTILDCIFGTGFRGEVKETARSAIEKINSSGAYVVSADINSGLNGDTGLGDLYVRSDLTVSIGTFKYGHFLGNAKDLVSKSKAVPIR